MKNLLGSTHTTIVNIWGVSGGWSGPTAAITKHKGSGGRDCTAGALTLLLLLLLLFLLLPPLRSTIDAWANCGTTCEGERVAPTSLSTRFPATLVPFDVATASDVTIWSSFRCSIVRLVLLLLHVVLVSHEEDMPRSKLRDRLRRRCHSAVPALPAARAAAAVAAADGQGVGLPVILASRYSVVLRYLFSCECALRVRSTYSPLSAIG